jgi:Leucine-rich repeat (LRR) protein
LKNIITNKQNLNQHLKAHTLEHLRSIRDKHSIEELDLTHDVFDEFPLEILDCVNLKVLKLSKGGGFLRQRQMHRLPEGINRLRKLEELEVIACTLRELPKTFWELKELTSLDLSSNPLERIPVMLSGCTKLKSLFLRECELEEFPSGLSLLPELEELDLSSNFMSFIPPEIAEFGKLKKLYLSYNPFSKERETETIRSIAGIKQLEELSMRRTGLSHLPEEWLGMKSIKEIDVSQNGIRETGTGGSVKVVNEQF